MRADQPLGLEFEADTTKTFPAYTRARRSDMDTSRAAAQSVVAGGVSLTLLQGRIHQILSEHPDGLTDEMLTRICDCKFGTGYGSGIRTRRAELVEIGRVRDSGRRTQIASGRAAAVWIAIPEMQNGEMI